MIRLTTPQGWPVLIEEMSVVCCIEANGITAIDLSSIKGCIEVKETVDEIERLIIQRTDNPTLWKLNGALAPLRDYCNEADKDDLVLIIDELKRWAAADTNAFGILSETLKNLLKLWGEEKVSA